MECGLVPPLEAPLHLPMLYRWAGRVKWCSSIRFFPALLNKGADHKTKYLRLCLWQGQESDFIDICAVHATCAPFPSRP